MGLVLATSAFVALERAGTSWEDALGSHGGEAVAVPAVVYRELLVGVAMAGNPETRRATTRENRRARCRDGGRGFRRHCVQSAPRWESLLSSAHML